MRLGDVTLTWDRRGERVLRDPTTGRWAFTREECLPEVLLEEIRAVGTPETETTAKTSQEAAETGHQPEPASGNMPIQANPLIQGNPSVHGNMPIQGSPLIQGNSSIHGNMLIHGDCLLACKALESRFAGRVSLVYADPPYNTCNSDLAYEDCFTHPVWLSFVSERVEAVKRLLRPGGICAVQIGAKEQPYLRAVLDKLFGRGNFISQISWQRAPDRTLLGQGLSLINDCVEYILLYSNGPVRGDLRQPVKEEPMPWKTLRTYGHVLEFSPSKDLVVEFGGDSGSAVSIFRHREYRLDTISVSDLRYAFNTSWGRLRGVFPRMARLTNQQTESTFQQSLISKMPLNDTLYSAEYVQSRGKHKGERIRYYLNKQVVLFLKDVAVLKGNSVTRTADLNNFWTGDELPATGMAREGGITLKRGKKPERLLHRIITAFSLEGETVLDPFAGSGTAGAVAHKTLRRWLMIDDSARAVAQMEKRMRRVAEGTDLGGVTRLTGWKGGGGFTVVRARTR